MKQIFQKYDKALIAELPRTVFEGRIFVVDSESEAERAVRYLLSQPILGFDTETRPNFQKWQHHKVALLQVASDDVCFLFRLCNIGVPDCVVRLLDDRQVLKVGLSWHDDMRMLRQRRAIQGGEFVELQQEIKKLGVDDMSLQKIYANLFGEKISKGEQLSNWEADILSEAQKRYAATDAWACVNIYKEIERLTKEKNYTLIRHEETVSEAPQG